MAELSGEKPRGRPIDWEDVRARLESTSAALTSGERPDARRQVILLRRAQALARPLAAGESLVLERLYLVLRMNEETYALPAALAQEVVPYRGCAPLPGLPVHLRGLLNVRGRILPVVDLPALWHGRSRAAPPDEVVVVLEVDGIGFGLVADSVVDVRSLEQPLVSTAGGRDSTDTSHLLGRLGELPVLHLRALLPDLIVDQSSLASP